MEIGTGCCTAIPSMPKDLLETREANGRGTVFPWMKDGTEDRSRPEGARNPVQEGAYPVFELGTWRFTVRTRDPRLIEDLRGFIREVGRNPRADVRFTLELVRCTEEGKLMGWAWQKERIPG